MGMRLGEALRADKSSRIAFVGAGGKTTAMFLLAHQLPEPVICLNTTHLAVSQARLADRHYIIHQPEDLVAIFEKPLNGVVLLTGPEDERQRLSGLPLEITDAIATHADRLALPVLVESDGARQMPLKAPASHEPPIPAWVNHVVYLVGLSGLCQPLTDAHVFRAGIFSELTNVSMGEVVGIGAISKYLLHPQGALKNIHADARKSVFFNQLDAWQKDNFWQDSAFDALLSVYDGILVGSLQAPEVQIHLRYEKVGGIVLAAGAATRMGKPKQLLDWQGKPLVRHVAEKAIQACLSPVVVVVGYAADEISNALADLPVHVVINADWESGQASSIRAGIESLPESTGAAIFLLSDMPGIPVALLKEEIRMHQSEWLSILCPRVEGQRTNPVLFDRQTFPELLTLRGDSGGRLLFDRFSIRWLDWTGAADFRDVDTPKDYERLLKREDNGAD